MNDRHIKSLDGLRAIAILLVMTFHAGITYFGWMGVQLFFVLSGFLIIGILWKEKFRDAPRGDKFKRFWIRRSLRIFPLYYAFLLVLGIGYYAVHFPASLPEYIIPLLTYTFNYSMHVPPVKGPFFTFLWSLCVEEQIYLIFPFILFFCSPRFIKWLLLTIVIAAPLIRFLIGEYQKSRGYPADLVNNLVYWNTFSHLDAFFLGGLIPVFALQTKIKRPQLVFYSTLILALLAGLFNFLHNPGAHHYINTLGYGHGEEFTESYTYVWEYTFLNLFFASFILLLVSQYTQGKFRWLHKLLEFNWMIKIGQVSYGMYVFHWGINIFAYAFILRNKSIEMKLLFFIPYLVIVYIISLLSYKIFESRFIRLKDKLAAK